MTDDDDEPESEPVGLPPTFKNALTDILKHAASSDRTVIEFRTKETESGRRYLAHALDITEHVSEMETELDETPDR